ncbi:MAG: DUF1801 domain-containing protein [Candidatus Promineofilum sp.]|nr:DUF1801 domain-containing protein [Promineifilum sp.]
MTPKQEAPQTIDAYITAFPEDVQAILQQIRRTIHEAAPEATEAISYQMPTFKLYGNLVHFGAFKNHIGFYPVPSGMAAFEEELAAYKQGRGSVQFPLNKPMPLDLIRRMVEFRVQESKAAKASKGSRA